MSQSKSRMIFFLSPLISVFILSILYSWNYFDEMDKLSKGEQGLDDGAIHAMALFPGIFAIFVLPFLYLIQYTIVKFSFNYLEKKQKMNLANVLYLCLAFSTFFAFLFAKIFYRDGFDSPKDYAILIPFGFFLFMIYFLPNLLFLFHFNYKSNKSKFFKDN